MDKVRYYGQSIPPANWFRFVDDTWCRLKKRVAADLFDHIHQIDDNIKFTQEPSHDNMLPFLDTTTIVKEDGNLRFEVYRKPTHTDQYLAFDSHHPFEHKIPVIKTLLHRTDNIITSDEAKTYEHRHLRAVLLRGYLPSIETTEAGHRFRWAGPDSWEHLAENSTKLRRTVMQGTAHMEEQRRTEAEAKRQEAQGASSLPMPTSYLPLHKMSQSSHIRHRHPKD
ncbi:hypothetical protein Bbelb_393350 [Branchiostoma belcheri]|nr:hypothetical protein Bbelb_393350 [Branchiostoma belcheri]